MASVLLLAAACGGPQAAAPAPAPPSSPSDVMTEPEPAPAEFAPGDLLPRDLLFSNPDRALVRLSPNGEWLTFLAPVEGALNLHVAPVADLEDIRVLTRLPGQGVRSYQWTYAEDLLLYRVDEDGDENWQVIALDVRSGEERPLSPESGVNARVESVSQLHPETIVVALNDRQPQLHDLHRVSLRTGNAELLVANPGFVGFLLTPDQQLAMAMAMTPDGGTQWLRLREGGNPSDGADWETAHVIGPEDAMGTTPVGFTREGDVLYWIDSRERDTSALFAEDAITGERVLIHVDPRADVSSALSNPVTGVVEAVAVEFERTEWTVIDEAVAPRMDRLRDALAGDVEVLSRTTDDRLWLVAELTDSGPVRYFLDDSSSDSPSFLFTNRERLAGVPLAPMHPVVIPSRDGLDLVSYLTLPVTVEADGWVPAEPLPMVLQVHGGPWARDSWGYSASHQWLANRGYAVLSVNFRGSTGFGKRFLNAGNQEWGAAMHDDLLDAVEWAAEQGIARRDAVAIMGGSYGGYAALAGMTFTPEEFACGVSIVGPSNLITLLESIPPYWAPMLELFATRVGDPRTEEGRALLEERSPLSRVDAIRRPLLIAQGANDPRVVQAESDQIVQAMAERGIPHLYALFPDEGHGFARETNRMAFHAVAEHFLGECLGGAVEPVGSAFEGSSIQLEGEGLPVPTP
ncbi:MAG: S9 family peptidase [Deltaproteobacteria bacterium]|nr:MAG: S9 family peptidase [Deltaproteobacteria bacterium]